jgi:hypothetical protein
MALTAARRIAGATAAFAALTIIASVADGGSLAGADQAV